MTTRHRTTHPAIAALAAALLALAGCAGTTSSPAATASAPPAASDPAPAASAPPPLSESFTSSEHGYSVTAPEGWTARPASQPWTAPVFPLEFPDPQVDWVHDPTLVADLFLAVASQPLGGSSADEWLAAQMASGEGCGTATEPVTVDGATGLIGSDGCTIAVVTSGGRGYWIQLYTGDAAPPIYDAAWFGDLLAGVQLDPGAAAS